MRFYLPTFCLLVSFGCTGELGEPSDSGSDTADPQSDSGDEPSDTGGDTGTTIEEEADWTLLVFMNGDNDLESSIWGDLNELEMVGSNADVNVIVQVDRHEDYWRGDGDWTEARRYYIEADTEKETPRDGE
mgnify:CR=1 FL=1